MGALLFGPPMAILTASALLGIAGLVWVLLGAVASVVGLV